MDSPGGETGTASDEDVREKNDFESSDFLVVPRYLFTFLSRRKLGAIGVIKFYLPCRAGKNTARRRKRIVFYDRMFYIEIERAIKFIHTSFFMFSFIIHTT